MPAPASAGVACLGGIAVRGGTSECSARTMSSDQGPVKGTEHLGRAAIFATVARQGSFSAAAKALGMARSTVSEHVSALEEALGVRILERTTRRVRLTEEGELLLERVNVALGAWQDAWVELEERRSEPVGTLRVTAPGGLASSFVAPVCAQMMLTYPRVEVELVVDDRVRDLVADAIDVAIRMAPLDGGGFRSRKIAETRTVVTAAPGVVDPAHGELEHLTLYPWVGHGSITTATYHLYDEDDALYEFRPRVRGMGSNSEGQIALVEGGCGLALMPAVLLVAALRQGRLVRAFPRFAGRRMPVYAVTPRRAYAPSRVARFLDLLGEAASDTDTVSAEVSR